MPYTADLTGGKTYLSSSVYSNNYRKEYAFDNNESTAWYASGYTNQWVGVDFGSGNAYAITKLRMLCNPSRLNAFKLQGSDNGTTWSDVYSGNRVNNTSWQEFTFTNTTSYRYYRILCDGALYASSNVSVTEAEMMATDSEYKSSGTYVSQPIPLDGLPDLRFHITRDEPTDTSVTASYAINDDEFTTPVSWTGVLHEGEIAMPEVTEGKFLWIKLLLETSDGEVTPSVSAMWLTEAEPNDKRIQINLTNSGRMKHPQGDVTINFTGSLDGGFGSMVEPFIDTFTPSNLTLFFKPNDPEYLQLANVAVTNSVVTEVFWRSYQLVELEYLTITAIAITSSVQTHIDDLEQ